MSRYTVTWREGAQNHLAQIWMETDDQPAVTVRLLVDQLRAVVDQRPGIGHERLQGGAPEEFFDERGRHALGALDHRGR